MNKEEKERKRKLLKEYEQTILEACNVRREIIEQAQGEFDSTKKKAQEKYHEALRQLPK